MVARKPKGNANNPATPTPLKVDTRGEETNRQALARELLGPSARHGLVTAEAAARIIERMDTADKPGLTEFCKAVAARSERAKAGDQEASSELLMSQAVTLDSIFTEYARIALVNIASHMDASERYMRLALKAQANSRSTLEALAKLHQPREQTVRHVHVNEGGQAVVADNFHHHAGGQKNAKTDEQPHAPEGGAAGEGPALSGPDPARDGVPIPSDQGREAVPDARRQGKRRAKRQ